MKRPRTAILHEANLKVLPLLDLISRGISSTFIEVPLSQGRYRGLLAFSNVTKGEVLDLAIIDTMNSNNICQKPIA